MERGSQWSQPQEQGRGVWGAKSLSLNLGMWLGMGSPTKVFREQSLKTAGFLFSQDVGCSMTVGLEGSGEEFGVLWPAGHLRMLLCGMAVGGGLQVTAQCA